METFLNQIRQTVTRVLGEALDVIEPSLSAGERARRVAEMVAGLSADEAVAMVAESLQ